MSSQVFKAAAFSLGIGYTHTAIPCSIQKMRPKQKYLHAQSHSEGWQLLATLCLKPLPHVLVNEVRGILLYPVATVGDVPACVCVINIDS